MSRGIPMGGPVVMGGSVVVWTRASVVVSGDCMVVVSTSVVMKFSSVLVT